MSRLLTKNKEQDLKQNVFGPPPIWFMRQAGRYHHHYQGLRKKHSFVELCREPELAAQVALGPILDFDFDVAILFSDILFPLEALGMGLEFTDSKGPQLGFSLNLESLPRLKNPEEALPQLFFQKKAMEETRRLLPDSKSLIGFIGGPWTLYVYAVEGSHKGALQKSKGLLPQLFPSFLEKLVSLLRQNIFLQLEGGAELVMIFDTAAGELSPLEFQTWVQPALLKLCRAFPGQLAYYSKHTNPDFFNEEFRQSPWAGMGVDHRWPLAKILKNPEHFNFKTPGFLQGNFDQSLFFQSTSDFKKSLDRYLEPFISLRPEERCSWICGLGHGVLPGTPEAHVHYFIQRVRELFQ